MSKQQIPVEWLRATVEAERRYGLPAGLLAAVIEQESNWRNVKSKPNRNGSFDAGLTQINSVNFERLGIKDAQQLLDDPILAIQKGAQVLSEEMRRFGGDVPKALMAYNGGAGRVRKRDDGGYTAPQKIVDYATSTMLRWGNYGGKIATPADALAALTASGFPVKPEAVEQVATRVKPTAVRVATQMTPAKMEQAVVQRGDPQPAATTAPEEMALPPSVSPEEPVWATETARLENEQAQKQAQEVVRRVAEDAQRMSDMQRKLDDMAQRLEKQNKVAAAFGAAKTAEEEPFPAELNAAIDAAVNKHMSNERLDAA